MVSEDFVCGVTMAAHIENAPLVELERRGRPTARATLTRAIEAIEKQARELNDLKKQNADLRARMADHFFAMSVPIGGA